MRARWFISGTLVIAVLGVVTLAENSAESTSTPASDQAENADLAKPPVIPEAKATTEKEMKKYTEQIPQTDVTFDMVPIKGGTFMMGSPETEKDRQENEGPQHKVKVDPFWMGTHEVSWDEYDIWTFSLDVQRREVLDLKKTPNDLKADAVARPTRPYVDMTFGMGHKGYPAISMTQLAARQYCKWLTEKTGRYYRLPTEAEWEYACRAGTTTAFSWGDDPSKVDEYAWYYDNSEFNYQKSGQKKPNPWGLYDMHGGVSEWVLDGYSESYYGELAKNDVTENPYMVPKTRYSRVVRGGSWEDDPDQLRSAARRYSEDGWKGQDPQLPKSVWYLTDAMGVGFRLVRPLTRPTEEEIKAKNYGPIIPEDARLYGQGKYDENTLDSFKD